MRALFVSSEVYPLVKTGGLADVSGALPPALATLGVDCQILMPGYPEALDKAEGKSDAVGLGDPFGAGEARLVEARLPGSGLPLWLIDCPALYRRPGGPYQDDSGQDWPDNPVRFALLGWTAARMAQANSPAGWRAELVHAHDWQAGLAPAYLRDWGEDRVATIMTIHNLAYQGLFPSAVLPALRLPWSMYTPEGLEFWNHVSFLKAGLVYADRLTTVSPTYAREIQTAAAGCGLEGLLAWRSRDLVGILNGTDFQVWDPVADPWIEKPFPPGDLAGKIINKRALQRLAGLDPRPDAPLFAVISRLNEHKGMDLVLGVLPALLAQGGQFVLLGTGDRVIEDNFRAAARAHPGAIAVTIGYHEPMAHQIQAGADVLLMPSRTEPCGLTQLYAYRYGTLPLVHRTGGLADTVIDATYDSLLGGTATGFVFDEPTPPALQWCVERAIALYRQPDQWRRMRLAAAAQDFGWHRSARRYRDLYQELIPVGDAGKAAAPAPV